MPAFDQTKAFEVSQGVILNDGAGIFSGTDDPTTGGGTSAPLGSKYIQTNGVVWNKSGAAATDWTVESSGTIDYDNLDYNVAEDSYTELTYSTNKVTDVIIWTDSGKTTKIRETNLTYTGNKVTTEVIKQYDEVGSLVQTLTNTYVYSGNSLSDYTSVLT